MIFLDSNAVIALLGTRANDWTAEIFAGHGRAALVCNLIVFAEVAVGFAHTERLLADFGMMEIEIHDLTPPVALRAATAFREYRRRGGPRSTMLPDFLIGAHAAVLGATLMTRDQRLASYFPELTFLTPETEHG